MNTPTPQLATTMASTLKLAEVIADTKAAAAAPANDSELTQEQALSLQADAAKAVLRDNGWKVTEQLFVTLSEMLQTTQLFIVPVFMEREQISAQLGEKAEAFFTRFDVLREDLANIADVAVKTYRSHAGRDGDITDADVELLSQAAFAYSKLQTQIEDNVGPEVVSLMAFLEEGGVGADILMRSLAASLPQEESQ